jgi:hypothetical protein
MVRREEFLQLVSWGREESRKFYCLNSRHGGSSGSRSVDGDIMSRVDAKEGIPKAIVCIFLKFSLKT